MAEPGVVALAGTVLAASLFGSAHCAGMCGGIAVVAAGETRGARLVRSAGYHAGRLASYLAVGGLAGLAGSVVDDAGALIGLQRAAAVAAGITIAAFGAIAVLKALGVRIGTAAAPAALVRLAQRVHAKTLRLPAAWRGLPLGLATPLLPCGWLYAFAAIAAAGGSALVGMAVMAAFWAGTVPALAAVAGGARLVLARLGRAAPVAMGLAMIAVGLHVVVARASLADTTMHRAAERAAALRTSGGASRFESGSASGFSSGFTTGITSGITSGITTGIRSGVASEVASESTAAPHACAAAPGASALGRALGDAVAEIADEVPPCCRREP